MNKEKDTVVFDLDDVIVKDSFLRIMEEFTGKKIDIDTISSYYIEDDVIKDKAKLQEFHDYLHKINIYDYGTVDEDAMHLLKRLSKTHEVIIFSSFFVGKIKEESGMLLKNKFDFLHKTFPFLDPNNFIFGRNKSIVSAKYFIDDRLDNLSGNSDIKILYSAYHNKNITERELFEKGIFRISTMKELEKCIYGEFTPQEMLKLVNDTAYATYKYREKCYEIKATVGIDNKKKIVMCLKTPFPDPEKAINYFVKRFGYDEGVFLVDAN